MPEEGWGKRNTKTPQETCTGGPPHGGRSLGVVPSPQEGEREEEEGAGEVRFFFFFFTFFLPSL